MPKWTRIVHLNETDHDRLCVNSESSCCSDDSHKVSTKSDMVLEVPFAGFQYGCHGDILDIGTEPFNYF